MKITALSIVFCAATVSAVQVTYPAATSYVYRNDNNGPGYQQLQGVAPYLAPRNFLLEPYPIQFKNKVSRADNFSPEPLTEDNIPNHHVIDVFEDDDNDDDESYHDDTAAKLYPTVAGHTHAEEGGSNYGEEHEHTHGEKGGKGHHTEAHHDESTQGSYTKGHHEGYSDNAEGEKKENHDEAAAHGKHHKIGQIQRGSDHGHKKHYSKGEDVTGYHKVFNKDEFKKDHDFYDYSDHAGHFQKHGTAKSQHVTEKGKHEEGRHHDSASDEKDYEKAKLLKKEDVDKGEHAHYNEEGHDNHYNDESVYDRKEGNSDEKGYGFQDEILHDEDHNYN